MTGTTPWQAQDNVEPIQADTIGAIANSVLFNTISGCAASYSGVNMQVTVASGTITHNGTSTAVAGNIVTLVSDPTNPRWTYRYINSSGVAAIVSGSPSATPAVPDTGANPTNGLDYVQAGLTVATNATYKLDKRVFGPAAPIVTTAAGPFTTTSTSAVDIATVTVAAAQGRHVRVTFSWSKLATAAQTVAFGIKVNSTVVAEAVVGGNAALAQSTSTQQAEDGICVVEFVVPTALHQNGLIGHAIGYVSSSGATTARKGLSPNVLDATNGTLTNPLPLAAMTALSIRAINGTTSNTAEVANIAVEVF